MSIFKIVTAILTLIVSILAAPLRSEVIRAPETGQSLEQRWSWARNQIKAGKTNSWVAYSIEQMMGENELVGSFFSSRKKFPTIREVLTGKNISTTTQPSPKSVREQARAVLTQLENGKPQTKVSKEVAFLFGFKGGQELDNVEISMIDLQFDLRGRSLIWLGEAEPGESIRFLQKLYSQYNGFKQKEELLGAIGIHRNPDLVIPVLSPILQTANNNELRGQACFWLGNQQDAGALKIIQDQITAERSEDVIEQCLVGISDMTIPGSTEAMIDWTSEKYNPVLREQAIFWLGQKTNDALPVLEKIALQDRNREIRKKAIFSLSELDTEAKTPALIKIARNHEDPETRKEAIFWLSQNYSEKTAATLKEFASDDRDLEIQKQAVFALSELEGDEGVDQLIQLAKSHKNPAIRKEAIFWLGESDHPRAQKALLDIIESN